MKKCLLVEIQEVKKKNKKERVPAVVGVVGTIMLLVYFFWLFLTIDREDVPLYLGGLFFTVSLLSYGIVTCIDNREHNKTLEKCIRKNIDADLDDLLDECRFYPISEIVFTELKNQFSMLLAIASSCLFLYYVLNRLDESISLSAEELVITIGVFFFALVFIVVIIAFLSLDQYSVILSDSNYYKVKKIERVITRENITDINVH